MGNRGRSAPWPPRSRRRLFRESWAPPALVCPLLVLGLAGPAQAQMQLGQITGVLTDLRGKPLPGVTVMVSGPALAQEQAEFSDPDGRYTVTQLPPGDNYVVRFYFGDNVVEQQGIRVSSGSTLTINRAIDPNKGAAKVVLIERAPAVDTGSSGTATRMNTELIQNTAIRGRTFESVLSLAPGSADVAPRGVAGGDVGVSFSGSTGNENNFLIDGLNTTDPNLGVIGTQLSPYFIKEVNVYSGGYQPEFGRATGGVVQVVTKTGSNEFHGGVFGSWQPLQLTPPTVARLGEALAVRNRVSSQFDVGFELGGPIVKDHIWFYVGLAPIFTTNTIDRVVRTQRFDPTTGRAQTLRDFTCPSYLSDDALCRGSRLLAQDTTEVRSTAYTQERRLYSSIAKVQFNINADHNITLSWIGSPNTFEGVNGVTREVDSGRSFVMQQVHDAMARYSGKLLDRKLLLEVTYGFHYQYTDTQPQVSDRPIVLYRAAPQNPWSLNDFESAPECARQNQTAVVNGAPQAVQFNPCPITSYLRNGFGLYNTQTLQRHVVMASATYFLRALGSHAIKAGFDFEYNSNENLRHYTGTDLDPADPSSGHRTYQTNASGTRLQIANEFFTRDAAGRYVMLDSFTGKGETRNGSWYLRDSWATSFLPGLLLNYGLRWELQEVIGLDGVRQIFLWDNIAPRVGVTYDWTRKGRSKLYANYGRFYQSVPLDINDRQFSGEGIGLTGSATGCPTQKLNPGSDREAPVPGRGCQFPAYIYNGGQYGQVAPGLSGQFINEVVVGYQHDVGWDVVLGVSYTYRNLGNIIEDMSTDGGNFYLIDNPGRSADPSVTAQLQKDVDALQAQVDKLRQGGVSGYQLEVAQNNLNNAQGRLSSYRAVPGTFPKAERNYHALLLTAEKRLSHRFSLLGSYTYSRTYGNYPGTFSSSNNQIDPNISSQYDLVDLLANRYGPLPTDRPHNAKLTGFYTQPIGSKGTLVASLTFQATSGRPILTLGFHPIYQAREVFILPPGAAGRTPLITEFSAHLGYEHQLPHSMRLSLSWDIINLFNQRAVTNVDDEYTASVVAPIVGGQTRDLAKLRDATGAPPVVNSNYGQPTAYQQPLFMRFGARLSF